MARLSFRNKIVACVQNTDEINPILVSKYFPPTTNDSKHILYAKIRDQLRLRITDMSDPLNQVYDHTCYYKDDIYKFLLINEKQRLKINICLDHIKYRSTSLSTMRKAAECLNLTRTTMHLGAYLMDCYMNRMTVIPNDWYLVVISCLCLAAKIEENDGDIPKFNRLNLLVGDRYQLEDFKKMQWNVIKIFDYNLIRPTTATFVEYFATNFLTLDDFRIYARHWNLGIVDHHHYYQGAHRMYYPYFNSFDEMVMRLTTSLFEMADISLAHVKFTNVCPSVVAAACVGAVRYLYSLPVWTPYLSNFIQYSCEFMQPYINLLISLHEFFVCNCKITTNVVLLEGTDSGINLNISSTDDDSYSGDNDTSLINGKIENELQIYENNDQHYPAIKKRRIC